MATWNDPSLLANPFNTRSYGNFNTSTAQRGAYIRHTANPKSLTVPNQDIPYNGSPEWYEMQRGNSPSLTVPNQDVPAGDRLDNYGNSGFLNDRLFRLADGTIMDFKTGTVIGNFGRKPVPDGCWNDPDSELNPQDAEFENSNSWNAKDGPSLDELVNHTDRWIGTAVPGGEIMAPLDPKSAAYWLKAEEEAEKLKAGMTDEQKFMLAAFEAHFPKSRLIEESKKACTGRIL